MHNLLHTSCIKYEHSNIFYLIISIKFLARRIFNINIIEKLEI